MARLGARLFSPQAGFFAALLLNLSPLFGVVFGSFVLPDGPLDAALLAAALLLVHALEADQKAAWWWAASGLAAGLALFSKYSAILVIFGVILYLLTEPRHRWWLAGWGPWIAGALALLVFTPVIAWNVLHHWISFGFQGDRAFGLAFHPLAPLVVFGGEALYLLPWIWLALVYAAVRAFRRGPRVWQSWFSLCLAAPAVLLFSVIAIWSRGRVLPHWAAPGYLMLFPLLGSEIVELLRGGKRWIAPALMATAGFVVAAAMLVGVEVRFGFIPFAAGHDPTFQMTDWTALRRDLSARGLLARPLVIAAVRWPDAGKIDYALGGTAPVIVLGGAPHEYGLIHPPAAYVGRTVLVIAPNVSAARMKSSYARYFASVETLPPIVLRHGGRPALRVPLYLGERFKG